MFWLKIWKPQYLRLGGRLACRALNHQGLTGFPVSEARWSFQIILMTMVDFWNQKHQVVITNKYITFHSPFGFRVSNGLGKIFGFRVSNGLGKTSGFGFRVSYGLGKSSGFGFRVSHGFENPSGFGFRVSYGYGNPSGFGFRVSHGLGILRVSGFGSGRRVCELYLISTQVIPNSNST